MEINYQDLNKSLKDKSWVVDNEGFEKIDDDFGIAWKVMRFGEYKIEYNAIVEIDSEGQLIVFDYQHDYHFSCNFNVDTAGEFDFNFFELVELLEDCPIFKEIDLNLIKF